MVKEVWKPLKVKRDPKVPIRYQREGWLAWNSEEFRPGSGVWDFYDECVEECNTRNGKHQL